MQWHDHAKRISVLGIMLGFLVGGCGGPITDPIAQEAFLASLGNTSITVFPAFVREDDSAYDESAALSIGAFLTDEGLADVTVSTEQVPITGPWHSNQSQMLQESAAEFAAYLNDDPVDTEYALLPEYLFLGNNAGVGGVHCYIVDADNRLAFVVLQNSHWPIFTEVNPQTVDDCTTILIEVLRESLVPQD